MPAVCHKKPVDTHGYINTEALQLLKEELMTYFLNIKVSLFIEFYKYRIAL